MVGKRGGVNGEEGGGRSSGEKGMGENLERGIKYKFDSYL